MVDYTDQLYRIHRYYILNYIMECQIILVICIKRIFINDSLLDRIPQHDYFK